VPPLEVAAASDLRYALPGIAALFEQREGVPARITFGSSGQLAAQIAQGAPFDVFLSASDAIVRRLADGGAIDRSTIRDYAIGRLALWVPRGAVLDTRRGLSVLLDPRVRFIAVANPQHAPYGAAAVQALRRAGLFDRLRPRLVFGENIVQTLQFAQTGNADAAIVALSLAVAPSVAPSGRFALIPATLHDPIRQAGGVTARARDPALARAFLRTLASPEAQAIFRRYGFAVPTP
jgi:molybdate transport system substrate-binding protein